MELLVVVVGLGCDGPDPPQLFQGGSELVWHGAVRTYKYRSAPPRGNRTLPAAQLEFSFINTTGGIPFPRPSERFSLRRRILNRSTDEH